MAKKEKDKSLQAKVAKAKDKAYGKRSVKLYDQLAFGKLSKAEKKNMNKMNAISVIQSSGADKVSIKDTGKYTKNKAGGGWPAKKLIATVSKVDADAYNLIVKRAKAKGLKGEEARAAIAKALKPTARTVKTERSRTATRAQGIANRQSKKRKSTDLTR